jgi:glycerol-3-phosphate dehydrogenase (NAD(P)+)
MTSIAVLGAGAWGTALAFSCKRAGNHVKIYTNSQQEFDYFQKHNASPRLSHLSLLEGISCHHYLEDVLPADLILMVVPAQQVRSVSETLQQVLKKETYVVLCSKGIELESGLLMSEVASSVLKNHSIAILSGPTFAAEVASDLPTAATIAHHELTTARFLASTLGSPNFRLYPSQDVIGVEIGGALKNVIAIASGIALARGMGENTRAALITRGLAEMARLGQALGADPETFLGLSGVGDLVLTCTSTQSRNLSFGLQLGKGTVSQDEGILTEGAYTVAALMKLGQMMEIDMPICQAVYNVLYKKNSVEEEIKSLLSRPFKAE